jgi:hypothetical protein
MPKPTKGRKPTKANTAKLKGITLGKKGGKDVTGQGALLACWSCGALNDAFRKSTAFICWSCGAFNLVPILH